MPSYHDLHITLPDMERTSIFNLPYNLVLTYDGLDGWVLKQTNRRNYAQEEIVLGSQTAPMRLDVAGHVFFDSMSDTKRFGRDIEMTIENKKSKSFDMMPSESIIHLTRCGGWSVLLHWLRNEKILAGEFDKTKLKLVVDGVVVVDSIPVEEPVKYETIEVELSDEEFLVLARMAHERDITLNQLAEEIIRQYLESLTTEADPAPE